MKWLDLTDVKHLYRLASSDTSYLVQQGWFTSASQRRPVDARGEPLPWLSYPFIDFIRPRLRPDMSIVEFGAGQSTLFWAPRVRTVFSVESDRNWYDELKGRLPANVELRHQPFDAADPSAYAHSADAWSGRSDIVLVDGPERDLTLRHAPTLLREGGVIVLDNARRAAYAQAREELVHRHGFKAIDFAGMAPGAARECVTALFYRTVNCLGI
jgi:hypothetical protein